MKHKYTRCHNRLIAALIQARLRSGLSQRQLCDKLKRGKTFVSVVELGYRRLEVCEFIEYAQLLGVDPAKLLKLVMAKH